MNSAIYQVKFRVLSELLSLVYPDYLFKLLKFNKAITLHIETASLANTRARFLNTATGLQARALSNKLLAAQYIK